MNPAPPVTNSFMDMKANARGKHSRMRLNRSLVRFAGLGTGVFVLLQAVPYGWQHSNPRVLADAPWPSVRAETIARSSCYDCHSNETNWPPHSYVAPASWLVRRDVDMGRDEINFSEWERGSDAGDAAEAVADGSMPPRRYTLLHPSARLTDAEKAALLAALAAMDEGDDDRRQPRARFR